MQPSASLQDPAQYPAQSPAGIRDSLVTVGWFVYRRLRFAGASLAGRNPLCPFEALPPLRDELRSIDGLVRSRRSEVEPLREGNGRNLWRTPLGGIWAPKGADRDYVRLVTAEMLSQVYPLTSVAKGATVIDAGANIGCFSRYAFLNGAAQVIAFEPSKGRRPVRARNARAPSA